MKTAILIFLAFCLTNALAQETPSPITFSGYLETYYSYDFGQPALHERPSFFYSFNRHNEVNLNIGMAKVNYSNDRVRGNLAFMGGTYAQYNLASEQGLLRNIFEANVGVKISKNSNLWLDAGIMPSHIGFESAIGKDCWNLTRSILADNSPYFESGVKLGFTSKDEKLYLAVMYLNGWQRIQRLAGNQTPAFGTQLSLKPNAKIVLNWSTFLGNEKPDSLRKSRFFNNFYGQFQLSEKFGLTAGFDIGMEQESKSSDKYNAWYCPIIIARYAASEKVRLAARLEYYSDEKGVIIATGSPNGFKTTGYSFNFDYLPVENVTFRIEGRGLSSKDKIFTLNEKLEKRNYFITSSMSISF